MKKTSSKHAEAEELAEYDFSRGARGKYAERYRRGTNVVVLAPDVAKVFTSADEVNSSLRALVGIIQQQRKMPVGK